MQDLRIDDYYRLLNKNPDPLLVRQFAVELQRLGRPAEALRIRQIFSSLNERDVAIAAHAGHEPALQLVKQDSVADFVRFGTSLWRWGSEPILIAGIAIFEFLLENPKPEWNIPQIERALKLTKNWLNCPCDQHYNEAESSNIYGSGIPEWARQLITFVHCPPRSRYRTNKSVQNDEDITGCQHHKQFFQDATNHAAEEQLRSIVERALCNYYLAWDKPSLSEKITLMQGSPTQVAVLGSPNKLRSVLKKRKLKAGELQRVARKSIASGLDSISGLISEIMFRQDAIRPDELLLTAIETSDHAMLRKLHFQGVHASPRHLKVAIERDSVDTFKLLLELGADPTNVQNDFPSELLPVEFALEKLEFELAENLWDRGCQAVDICSAIRSGAIRWIQRCIDNKTSEGRTGSAISDAIETGNLEICKLVINHVPIIRDWEILAVIEEDKPRLLELLYDRLGPGYITERPTIMEAAIDQSSLQTIQHLLDMGIKFTENSLLTAISRILDDGEITTFKALLSLGLAENYNLDSQDPLIYFESLCDYEFIDPEDDIVEQVSMILVEHFCS